MSESEKETGDWCAIHGCRNAPDADVFIPLVVDKQVSFVEDYYKGEKWVYRAVVWHKDGPTIAKKTLAKMCSRHAKDWEAVPEA